MVTEKELEMLERVAQKVSEQTHSAYAEGIVFGMRLAKRLLAEEDLSDAP